MDKHRRWSIVIDAGPEIGLVGVAPVGFWGVGSMEVYIKEGDEIKRGDYIGHFLYGGSSILLTFEPGIKFDWVDDDGNMLNSKQKSAWQSRQGAHWLAVQFIVKRWFTHRPFIPTYDDDC